ncbi:hypothetical protein [Pseudomonas sp. DP-17]|uniref:hypothetical protein n=1 Tax=Pseudomonas sp. DP-17 TaxID=1580486 RepID=UPI001EFBA591|nr:hypothetical protein [Pseudomonas sp. DP-17]MCG8906256.1 hypothetical protein [Pseudomonas sp. DP-17]
MSRSDAASDAEESLPPSTAPNFGIKVTGLDSEEISIQLGTKVGEWVRAFSRYIDLSALDGVTIAVDYDQALVDLDRGYDTTYKLSATKSHVVGVAMTPSVIREGELKSHIVFNAAFMAPLLGVDDSEEYGQALHIIAHECAHVDVTHAYDRCFPNTLLREAIGSILDKCRWQVIFAVWDEYAVTSMIGRVGASQTDAYEQAFLSELLTFDDRVASLISAYRLHGDVSKVLVEVYGACGNLLKYSAYHLGNLRSFNTEWRSCQQSVDALEGHWFLPYFDRLGGCCNSIHDEFGQWESQEPFLKISGLAEELVERAGLFINVLPDGAIWVDIP